MSKGTVGTFKNFCGKEIMSFIECPWFFLTLEVSGCINGHTVALDGGVAREVKTFSRSNGVFFMRVWKPKKSQKMLTCAKGFVIRIAVPQYGTGLFRRLRFQGEGDEDEKDDVIGEVYHLLYRVYVKTN